MPGLVAQLPGLVAHLSVSELEQRFSACRYARIARQTQAIWLLAKGRSFAEAAAATAFSERWVCRLCERYNAEGLDALSDRRRHNGAAPRVLGLGLGLPRIGGSCSLCVDGGGLTQADDRIARLPHRGWH